MIVKAALSVECFSPPNQSKKNKLKSKSNRDIARSLDQSQHMLNRFETSLMLHTLTHYYNFFATAE